MCGRSYLTYSEEELYFRYFNRKTWPWPTSASIPSFKSNFNMCPTHTTLVLSVFGEALSFRPMRWGLVPSWSKTVKDADRYSMINARIEEIKEKRSYKNAFQTRRCVIPVSGFYEWKRSADSKTPFAIHLTECPIMSLAGIWERWSSKESNEIVDSFSIATTASNTFMNTIHTRMPIILNQDNEQIWLSPSEITDTQLASILEAGSSIKMSAYEVTKLVNSVKNNSPDLLTPANA